MENIILPQIKTEILDEEEPNNSFLEVPLPVFEASFIETANKTLKYKCPMCNKKFKSKEKVQSHVNSHVTIHSIYANGDFKCSECNSYFDTKENFQLHIETHRKSRGRPRKESVSSDDDIKPFICDKCAKGFKRKQQLLIHNLVHYDIKPFQCDLCEKSFKLKQQLQNHSKVHEDIRPFSCDDCEKSFKFKQQLENHSKTHTDIRPFKCLFCEKAFKFKQQLQNHYRVHDDLRPFICDFCDKAFKLKQQLQFHNKVHSDERPFQCFTCEKSFKFKQQLKNHYKVHNKIFIDSSILEPSINLETMDISSNLDSNSFDGKESENFNLETILENDNLKTNNLNVERFLNDNHIICEGQINNDNLTPVVDTSANIVKKQKFAMKPRKKIFKKNIANFEEEISHHLIPSGKSKEQNFVENAKLAMKINSENKNIFLKQNKDLLNSHLEKNSILNLEKEINHDLIPSVKSTQQNVLESAKLTIEIKSENKNDSVKQSKDQLYTHLEKKSTLNFEKEINNDIPSDKPTVLHIVKCNENAMKVVGESNFIGENNDFFIKPSEKN